MSTRAKIGLTLVIVAFLAWVVYSSFRLNQFSCDVCMEFNGLRNCGSASGTTMMEARSTAISVACANITAGVTENMACLDLPPATSDCREN